MGTGVEFPTKLFAIILSELFFFNLVLDCGKAWDHLSSFVGNLDLPVLDKIVFF